MTEPARRLLVVAHGHPAFSKGGAELAAWHLFNGFRARPGWDAWLLARHGEPALQRPGAAFHWLPGGREALFDVGTDPFLFSAQPLHRLVDALPELLREIRPDVVHLHHYVNLGVEFARVVRNTLPAARIVMTLHEYLAICNRSGQLLRSGGEPCLRASPPECHACVPTHPPQDYYLRERHLKAFLASVDAFIAPSEFLRARYVDWGLPAERIQVLPNVLPPLPRVAADGDGTRFAYFGQITPFKGVDLLLRAWAALPEARRARLRLSVFGGGQARFGAEFAARIDRLLDRPDVTHRPAYAPDELPALMAQTDWVVVPSIWWENAPLVIQEARACGRPVICAGVGGMAEHVHDGVDGLHFVRADAADLARVLLRAAGEPGLWARLRDSLRPPPAPQAVLDAHARLYAAE